MRCKGNDSARDKTYMRSRSLLVDSHSFSSSLMSSSISVPRPSVLPRGSGKTSKESPDEDETKVYCCGFGLDGVAGGKEDTRTVGETRKLQRQFMSLWTHSRHAVRGPRDPCPAQSKV